MADVAQDAQAELESQIADLKSELASLTKSLGSRASELADDAEDMFEDGRNMAGRAAQNVRRQASYAARVARRNPGTTATVLATVGLLGLGIGMVLGSTVCNSQSHSRRRW